MLNQDQQAELVRPFSEEEVQAAMKGLNAEGAPGLDSLPVFFYSEYWGLVRSEVMATLEEFQHGTRDMMKINKSHLFFLPKCQGANRLKAFRPISLSNSIYLIILKVLAN